MKSAKEILESMALYPLLQKHKGITMQHQPQNQLLKTMNATIVTGEYTDRQTGQQKKSYLTIGKLFVYNDGGMSLKLDALPMANQNIVFYDIKPKQPQQNQQGYSQNQPPPQQQNYNNGNGGYQQ